jgi:hypothetical protein
MMTDVQEANTDVFTLTAMIDCSAALQAAQRLYQSSNNGLRFFSELNRAVPKARAAALVEELETIAEAECLAE